MIAQNWCTIDGKSWTMTQGDEKAIVELMSDEKTYLAIVRCNEDSCSTGTYDCIKKARKACIDEIAERLYQEANS